MGDRISPISDQHLENLLGKVFVDTESKRVNIIQVTGKTKSYIRARRVPLINTYGPSGYGIIHQWLEIYILGLHKIDWNWVKSNPVEYAGSFPGTFYSLHPINDTYCLKYRLRYYVQVPDEYQTFLTVQC